MQERQAEMSTEFDTARFEELATALANAMGERRVLNVSLQKLESGRLQITADREDSLEAISAQLDVSAAAPACCKETYSQVRAL